MDLLIRDQHIELLPEKAAFWQEKKTLIVSDIHLGKATFFQKKGIPVPEKAMDEDLRLLRELIERKRPQTCLIVGDLIHAGPEMTEENVKKIEKFLNDVECEVHLIFGNHDKHFVRNLPKTWKLICHLEAFVASPFYFSHVPKSEKNSFVWSGHLHPCFVLKKGFDALRLPCFVVGPDYCVLPAFSSFVGHSVIEKKANEKIFVIADKEVVFIK